MTVVDAPADIAVATRLERGPSRAQRLRRAVASRVYLPACSVAAMAVALVWIGWSSGFGGAGFAGSVADTRLIVVGPASLLLIAVFLVAERVRPAQRRPLIARGHRQDLLWTILNATLVVPLVTALSLSFSDLARTTFPWIVLPRNAAVPRWLATAGHLRGHGRAATGSPISPTTGSGRCGGSTSCTTPRRT